MYALSLLSSTQFEILLLPLLKFTAEFYLGSHYQILPYSKEWVGGLNGSFVSKNASAKVATECYIGSHYHFLPYFCFKGGLKGSFVSKKVQFRGGGTL